jgi:hypothetical protein
MKGIIFNLLERVVTDELGEAGWERVLDEAGLDGAYTAVGTYDDEELLRLARAAASISGRDFDDVVRRFGEQSFPYLVERYPVFVSGYVSTIPFLLQLNDVIHPEVRKLFPGAYAPEFEFDQVDASTLALGYVSYRYLCAFAEGLVAGAAAHFGEAVSIEHTACARRGNPKCVLVCRFT